MKQAKINILKAEIAWKRIAHHCAMSEPLSKPCHCGSWCGSHESHVVFSLLLPIAAELRLDFVQQSHCGVWGLNYTVKLQIVL